MGKIKNIIKKISNLDVAGLEQGLENLSTGKMDDVAKERAKICVSCPSRVPETIQSLAIQDPTIPELSGHYCDECGCELSLLLRQNKKKCKLKKW